MAYPQYSLDMSNMPLMQQYGGAQAASGGNMLGSTIGAASSATPWGAVAQGVSGLFDMIGTAIQEANAEKWRKKQFGLEKRRVAQGDEQNRQGMLGLGQRERGMGMEGLNNLYAMSQAGSKDSRNYSFKNNLYKAMTGVA